jgi:CDP-glucose 4,6-dehydratase
MGTNLYSFGLLPPTTPSLFEEANVGDRMTSILGDIRDYSLVLKAINSCKPDIIIHMAAQSLVQYSYQAPVETYSTNVMGTVHLLEAARQVGTVKAIVNVTSDKSYENKEWIWGYREDEPMGGFDPYSSSKGCSELISSAYRRSFFDQTSIALGSARAGNVIGGGDWAANRLVPDILRAFERGQPATIRNPSSVRPWQHVLEPLSGYLILAEHLYKEGHNFAEGWNFGPRDEGARPVQWIVERMVEKWGGGATWRLDEDPRPHEANYLKLDSSKARTKLGWQPCWDIDITLEKIVEWHHAWIDKSDLRAMCLQQIKEYQKLI